MMVPKEKKKMRLLKEETRAQEGLHNEDMLEA
jgi:hypothetical protein